MSNPPDLRDALIAHIAERHNLLPGQCGGHADALIAGPLMEALAAAEERGAETMRSACARWHNDRAAEYDREARERRLPDGSWAGRDAMWARADAQAHREYAVALRALTPCDAGLKERTQGGRSL